MAGKELSGDPLPGNKSVDVMQHACKDHVFCRVSILGDDESGTATAKMLYTEHLDDGSRDLQISVPQGWEKPDERLQLKVAFDYDDTGMFFASEFRQHVIFREKSRKADAWRIAYPSTIYTMQRRAFYRVKADIVNPTMISISVPDHEEEENPDIIDEMDTFDDISGVLWDMSGGGLSFLLKIGPDYEFTQGMVVDMAVALPGTHGKSNLRGRIVYIKQRPDGENLYCVQFVAIGRDLDAQQSQNNVLHYVAQRERELIAAEKRFNEE